MTLKINLDHKTTALLVNCYALIINSNVKDHFYNQLWKVISTCDHWDKLVLLGDLNARVGSDHQTWESIIDCNGLGQMNSNDLQLLFMYREFDLSITNTLFQQPSCRKSSWMHPRSKDWHLIDFVITKQRDVRDFLITRSFHATCYLSDHALLRSKLMCRPKHKQLQKSSVPKRLNVSCY